MQLRRAVLSAIAVGLVTTTMTAHAATKVCYLVKDIAGDGKHTLAGAVLKSPALDIRSADVATGKKNFYGVLRLTTTDTSNDNVAKIGFRWYLNFVVQGKNYSFERTRQAGQNDTYSVGMSGLSVTPKVTVTKTSITWMIPKKSVPGLTKAKAVISNINASTAMTGGNADAATTMLKYVDQTPSCVKVS